MEPKPEEKKQSPHTTPGSDPWRIIEELKNLSRDAQAGKVSAEIGKSVEASNVNTGSKKEKIIKLKAQIASLEEKNKENRYAIEKYRSVIGPMRKYLASFGNAEEIRQSEQRRNEAIQEDQALFQELENIKTEKEKITGGMNKAKAVMDNWLDTAIEKKAKQKSINELNEKERKISSRRAELHFIVKQPTPEEIEKTIPLLEAAEKRLKEIEIENKQIEENLTIARQALRPLTLRTFSKPEGLFTVDENGKTTHIRFPDGSEIDYTDELPAGSAYHSTHETSDRIDRKVYEHGYTEPYPDAKLESDPKIKSMLDKFEEAIANAKSPEVKAPEPTTPAPKGEKPAPIVPPIPKIEIVSGTKAERIAQLKKIIEECRKTIENNERRQKEILAEIERQQKSK